MICCRQTNSLRQHFGGTPFIVSHVNFSQRGSRMVKINDEGLKPLLQDDFERDAFKGISKEFVSSYLKTENPDNKLICSLVESLSSAEGTNGPEWLKQFLEMIDRLQSYETLLYSMRGYRDHIAHVIRVSLLGYYLMMRPPLNKLIDCSEDFQTKWLLTSLFHDICIPLSRLKDVQLEVSQMMSTYSGIHFSQQAEFGLIDDVFTEMKRILHDDKAEFCIELIQKITQAKHGALAAAVVLHTFQGHINGSVLQDIVKSIFLHDDDCNLSFDDNRLATLLIVSDELQEWDRPFVDRMSLARVLKLNFVDIKLSDSLISAKFDYHTPSSIDGYIPIEVDEVSNFEKKSRNLGRISLPFGLAIQITDRCGNTLTYPKVTSTAQTSHS